MNGVVTGNGTFRFPGSANALTVTGTYLPPALSLTLQTPGFEDTNLSATVEKDRMRGTLNGSGFQNESVTLARQ
jgi:hypothetical protein